MKHHILTLLAVFLVNTTFAQSLNFEQTLHDGGWGVMPTVQFKDNYYIMPTVLVGKCRIIKFNSDFKKLAEVETDFNTIMPKGKSYLAVVDIIATSNNLFVAVKDRRSWMPGKQLMFYKVNADLSLGSSQLFSDHYFLSNDKTKIAFINKAPNSGEHVKVGVADENLSILWEKFYAYSASDVKNIYIHNVQVANDGQTVTAFTNDSAAIKGIVCKAAQMFPFEHKVQSQKVFDCNVILKDNTAALIVGLMGDVHSTEHQLKCLVGVPINLTTGAQGESTKLILDPAIFTAFKPDNGKGLIDVAYSLKVLPLLDSKGYYAKIKRIESRERTVTKTSSSVGSDGTIYSTTFQYPIYTDEIVAGINESFDLVKFSHTCNNNYRTSGVGEAYTGGAYLVKDHCISIDRTNSDPTKKFAIALISPDGTIKNYSSDHRKIPAWTLQLTAMGAVDENSMVIRFDTGDYGFIKISVE